MVERRTPQLGLLVSVIVHAVLIMFLLSVPVRRLLPIPTEAWPELGPRLVFSTPPSGKDRISIGAPSEIRRRGAIELERDEDITASIARGLPEAGDAPPEVQEPSPGPSQAEADGQEARSRPVPAPIDPGNRLVFEGRVPSGTGPRSAGLGATLRDLDRRLGAMGPLGLESGTGQQMGPLFFDPQGADFTQWINHFRNEVYRNWLIPQPALLGMRGEVEIVFTVLREGRVTELHIVTSSGNVALDRAAANALISSHLLPLPVDFGPPTVIMRGSFFYNTRPPAS